MRAILSICAALAVSGTLFSPSLAYSQDGMVSLDDVVLLATSDVADQTIVVFLKHRKRDFALDAVTLKRLREDGVSEKIIRYMQQQDASSVVTTPAYVVATGYNSVYPSYYFGVRLVGTAAYPPDWYNHHYHPLGIASVYRSTAHYDQFSNDGHSAGGSLSDSMLTSGASGGNHLIDHSAYRVGQDRGYHR